MKKMKSSKYLLHILFGFIIFICLVIMAQEKNLVVEKNVKIEKVPIATPIPIPGDEALLFEENYIPHFFNIDKLKTMDDLEEYLYTVDETAYVSKDDLNIASYVMQNFKSELHGKDPKILIFHTHSQETLIDSRAGEVEDSIVGVGNRLAKILADEYHIPVIHDVGQYDVVNGEVERGKSYETMEPAIREVLKKHPSIEVTIDLHRDGLPDNMHLVTEIDGRSTAKIMFFNGITRLKEDGKPKSIPNLYNPYLKESLALSLQMQLTTNEFYPGFARKIYIKPYRYSLHLLPKSMLVEVGANTNTVEEAKNAMIPLAKVLVEVLDANE